MFLLSTIIFRFLIIVEDEVTLDFIESEMAQRGITQEMIDETRASTENVMLADLKALVKAGEELEFRDALGATPVRILHRKALFTTTTSALLALRANAAHFAFNAACKVNASN